MSEKCFSAFETDKLLFDQLAIRWVFMDTAYTIVLYSGYPAYPLLGIPTQRPDFCFALRTDYNASVHEGEDHIDYLHLGRALFHLLPIEGCLRARALRALGHVHVRGFRIGNGERIET